MATEPGFVPSSSVNIEVEGDITVPGAPEEDEEPSTLDEPVSETLVSRLTLTSGILFIVADEDLIKTTYLFEHGIFQKRDLKAVGRKFFHIFWPRHTKSLLRDCKCIVLVAATNCIKTKKKPANSLMKPKIRLVQ